MNRFLAAQLSRPSGLVGRMMGAFFDRTNRGINAHTLKALDIQPGDVVLEVGFGGGAALAGAADRTKGGRVIGVDRSPVMVRRAKRKFRKLVQEGRVELHERDVHDLPFDAGTFDRAYSVNTVYFWADPAAALREIRRVLKEGGRFVLAMRSPDSLDVYRFPEEVLPSRTPEEVHSSLEAAGFADIRLEHKDKGERLDTVLAVARASSTSTWPTGRRL